MKFLIRRFIFWSLIIGIGIGAAYFLVVGPDFSDYIFQEGPRYIDGSPYRGFSELWDEDPKIIIHVYWRTGCPACKEQLVYMKNIHGDDAFVIAIGRESVVDVASVFPPVFFR